MKFYANYVSTSASGDYYQALFEEEKESAQPDSSYLLIQRQFEIPDNGKCYIETHDGGYIGHFRLAHIDFKTYGIYIELDRPDHRNIHVEFSLPTIEFEKALPVLNILSGEVDCKVLGC